jgi:hypothetical protein
MKELSVLHYVFALSLKYLFEIRVSSLMPSLIATKAIKMKLLEREKNSCVEI